MNQNRHIPAIICASFAMTFFLIIYIWCTLVGTLFTWVAQSFLFFSECLCNVEELMEKWTNRVSNFIDNKLMRR